MNQLPKVVFSKTLDRADWQNTTLVTDHLIEEITHLKQEPGKDLMLLGSGVLVSELTKHRLIDEYQLMVNPVVLGSGNPLFKDLQGKAQLKLVESKPFQSGKVLLKYEML